jgi:hypothetical protein
MRHHGHISFFVGLEDIFFYLLNHLLLLLDFGKKFGCPGVTSDRDT